MIAVVDGKYPMEKQGSLKSVVSVLKPVVVEACKSIPLRVAAKIHE